MRASSTGRSTGARWTHEHLAACAQWAHRVAPACGSSTAGWIAVGTNVAADKIDIFRTYDVHPSVAIPETIRRIAGILRYPRENRTSRGLINCEDSPYIGAGLGCV